MTIPSRFPGRALVAVTAVVALVLGSLLLDDGVAEFLAQPIRSGQLQGVLRAMRCWGEGATIVVLALGISVAHSGSRKRMLAVLAITLACAGTVDLIKPLVGRSRPGEASGASAAASWTNGPGWNSSFPSGHTATAFAFGRGLSLCYPPLRPVCLVAASGTGLSRMYEQRHYASDCVVGALLGWYLAGVLWGILARLATSAGWLTDFAAPSSVGTRSGSVIGDRRTRSTDEPLRLPQRPAA